MSSPLKITLVVAALAGLSACEPYPEPSGCQPMTDDQGRTIVGCTPDGRPILVSPQAPQRTQSFPPPATNASPPPVQTGPIGGTVASGTYGPVPTVIEDTGEALPPPPATLEPVTPSASTPSTTTQTPPAPVVTAPVSSDPNALPTVVAPPPADVVATFGSETSQ